MNPDSVASTGASGLTVAVHGADPQAVTTIPPAGTAMAPTDRKPFRTDGEQHVRPAVLDRGRVDRPGHGAVRVAVARTGRCAAPVQGPDVAARQRQVDGQILRDHRRTRVTGGRPERDRVDDLHLLAAVRSSSPYRTKPSPRRPPDAHGHGEQRETRPTGAARGSRHRSLRGCAVHERPSTDRTRSGTRMRTHATPLRPTTAHGPPAGRGAGDAARHGTGDFTGASGTFPGFRRMLRKRL